MNKNDSQQLVSTHGVDKIIERLEPYVTQRRKERIEAVINARLKDVHLAVECPADINNAFAAVRTCEALGISTIHIINPEGDAKGARATTQGAVYWVNIQFYDSLTEFLQTIKDQNFLLAGGIMSATVKVAELSVKKPICIILGNEQRGLSKQTQTACDMLYSIPMYGMSESLNLSVSAAISLYDITTRKRQQLKQDGNLTVKEAQVTRAKYYLQSVKTKLVEGLLNGRHPAA